MSSMKLWMGLMAGGAFGASARYFCSGAVQRLFGQRAGETFIWGTLTVNVLGCLLMGILTPWFLEKNIAPEYRTAILVGVLGAFTTWSSFGMETIKLLNGGEGQARYALLYVLGTNALCFSAVWLGYRLAQKII